MICNSKYLNFSKLLMKISQRAPLKSQNLVFCKTNYDFFLPNYKLSNDIAFPLILSV